LFRKLESRDNGNGYNSFANGSFFYHGKITGLPATMTADPNKQQKIVSSPLRGQLPDQYYEKVPLPHSVFGVASVMTGMFCGLLVFAMVVYSVMHAWSRSGGPQPRSILGTAFYASMFLFCLVGIGLGVTCVTQSHINKLYGIIGLGLNAVILFGLIVAMLVM